MSAGVLIALLIGIAALTFVFAPLFRKDAAEAEMLAAASSELRDLRSRKEMLMASLRDLDDDRQTGKIDEQDYEQLKGRLTAQAVEVMKRLDELQPAPAAPSGPVPLSVPPGPPSRS
jgi:hypothetical protein